MSILGKQSEKDKKIKELENKIRELQEIDNKRAFRLYAVLYDVLEKQDSENVASRIDYLTGKDYSEMCELYKTAKNIKNHDKEVLDNQNNFMVYALSRFEELMNEFHISCIDELHERLCWVTEQARELDKIYDLLKTYDIDSVDALKHFLEDDIQKFKLYWAKNYAGIAVEGFQKLRRAFELACEKIADITGSCPVDVCNWQQDKKYCENNCDIKGKLCWDRYFLKCAEKGGEVCGINSV